jgi:hypothetical protein
VLDDVCPAFAKLAKLAGFLVIGVLDRCSAPSWLKHVCGQRALGQLRDNNRAQTYVDTERRALCRSYKSNCSEQSAIILRRTHSFSSAQLKQRLRGRVGSAIWEEIQRAKSGSAKPLPRSQDDAAKFGGRQQIQEHRAIFQHHVATFLTTSTYLSIQYSRRRAAALIQANRQY